MKLFKIILCALVLYGALKLGYEIGRDNPRVRTGIDSKGANFWVIGLPDIKVFNECIAAAMPMNGKVYVKCAGPEYYIRQSGGI